MIGSSSIGCRSPCVATEVGIDRRILVGCISHILALPPDEIGATRYAQAPSRSLARELRAGIRTSVDVRMDPEAALMPQRSTWSSYGHGGVWWAAWSALGALTCPAALGQLNGVERRVPEGVRPPSVTGTRQDSACADAGGLRVARVSVGVGLGEADIGGHRGRGERPTVRRRRSPEPRPRAVCPAGA